MASVKSGQVTKSSTKQPEPTISLPTDQVKQWTREDFLISTDPSLIPLADLNNALASEQMFWAVPLTDDELELMIRTSVCFGLYHVEDDSTGKPALIGLARLVTDRVTFAYLTDVYVLPNWGARGLGSWLTDCVKEWVDMVPKLRQFVLITGQGKKEEYYGKKFGTARLESLKASACILVAKGSAGTFISGR